MAPKAPDPRVSWISSVSRVCDVTPFHRLQLASLSSSSGYPICSAPLPSSTKAKHALESSPIASSSKPKLKPNGKGEGKGKAANEPIEVSSDDDDDPINSFSDDELEVEPPKHTESNKRKCEGNPNCLKWLGSAQWEDKEKALESFLKTPLLGPNPMDISRAPGVPVGLKNLGATCYAAALLQTWFHNHRFRNAVYRLATTVEPNQTLKNSPAHQLQTVFYGLQESALLSWDPKGLVESLELNEDQQQDAQEFSKLFMSMLATEFAKQEDEDLKSLVEDQFEGDLSYVTKCKKCKTKSERPSKFLELELTMTPNAKLEDRIDALLAAETLSGDNKYNCSHCESLQDAERKIELTSLPPIIHFSLLRFVFDPETLSRKKSKSIIRFPSSIDMATHLSKPKSKGKGKKAKESEEREEEELGTIYDLKGVLVHKGSSAYSGHYCAEVYREEDDKWYNCDDERVEVIKSLTPPRTDKPFRPVVDASTKTGTIDSYFDKTPKPKEKEKKTNGKGKGKKAGTPWSDAGDTSSDEVILIERTAPGVTNRLAGSKRPAPPISNDKTPVAKKAKAEIDLDTSEDEAKIPPYHTSKDAYMLVYARREPSSSQLGSPSSATATAASSSSSQVKVPSVIPPKEVVEAIESANDKHQLDCEEWAARQTVLEQTFEEVHALKTAVFGTWEVSDFDEAAYLVEKSALVEWTNQGLNIKSKKKATDSPTLPAAILPPESTSTEPIDGALPPPTNGDLPLPPPPPPSDPSWKPELEDVAMKDPEQPEAPKQEEDVPMVAVDEKKEEEVKEEVKPLDAKDVRELAIKQACEKTFLNHSLLCAHGNIDPRPSTPTGTPFKRISATAFKMMQSQLGCEFQPVVPVDAGRVCEICTKEIYVSRTYRVQHPKDISQLKMLCDAETDRSNYEISKKWFHEFIGPGLPSFFNASNERDPMPTEEPWRSDTICEHGEKATKSPAQKLIAGPAYNFLQTIFPDLVLYRYSDESCPICEAADYQKRADAEPDIKRAQEEKASLSALARSLKASLDHEELTQDEDYAVIDPEFLRTWSMWIKNPVGKPRPDRINNEQYICEHGLVDFDVNNKHDRREKRYAAILEEEFDKLAATYHGETKIIFRFYEKEPSGSQAIMDPAACTDCRRLRKKDFDDGFIRAHIIQAKDDPRLPENKKKTLSERSDSPPIRGYGNKAGSSNFSKKPSLLPTRQSTRQRTSVGEKKPRILKIPITTTSTVKDFKMKVASRLNTTVLHLSLRRDDVDLDDNSKLLSQVDCLPGDIIQVIEVDGQDQDEDAFLNNSDGDDDFTASRRRQEANSGFGGTRLGGGSGGRATNGNGIGNGKRSREASAVSGVEDDWDLGLGQQDVAMGGAAAAGGGGSGVCPTCTFENAAGMVACEMCSTALS